MKPHRAIDKSGYQIKESCSYVGSLVALSASALVDEHVEGGRGRAGPGNFSKPEGPKAQEVSAAANVERRGEWWGSGKENREAGAISSS